jgi:voltage-gated potassium channel
VTLDELSVRLRGEHNATLLAVARGDHTLTNPPADFRLAPGDTAVVVADSLGDLHPLKSADALGAQA